MAETGSFLLAIDTWKVAGFVGSLFLVIGVPVVWLTSNLNSKIENIGGEVNEIKRKTEKLFVLSIRNEERLNNTEKSIERIEGSIQALMTNKPNKKVNKDASR